MFIGCSPSQDNGENNTVKNKKKPVQQKIVEQEIVKQEIVEQEETETSICDIALNIDKHLQEIINNPQHFINNQTDDNCVLAIVNTVSKKSIETGYEKYLDALSSICNISDGYLSEYFLEIGIYQFYDNFENIIGYLLNEDSKSCLRRILIESVSMEMSDGGDKIISEINRYLDGKLNESNISEKKAEFIKQMRVEFDPSLFD